MSLRISTKGFSPPDCCFLVLVALPRLLEVGASAEGGAGGLEQDGAGAVVGERGVEVGTQLAYQLPRERVAIVG